MNSMLTASSKHEDLMKELRIDMDKNLEPGLNPKECCIYRVRKRLRNLNEEAYTPQMVSIGPFHRGNKELANLEKIKRSYMKNFFEQREMMEKQDDIFSFVKNNENRIRNCYAEISNLKSYEYIIMILYDAIFIIELFMRNYKINQQIRNDEETSDSFMFTIVGRNVLRSDLELLENQLPYFVLDKICKIAFDGMPTFNDISCSFFGSFENLRSSELTSSFSVKHFTDWRRSTLLKKYVGPYSRKKYIFDLPCVMKLHESGVKLKKIEGEGKLLFEKHRDELQLPQLQIVDGTECTFRNVMALEQCLYPWDTHICNYVYLMDCLIDTEKDVDLLVESGIISNLMGDKSSIASMFNKLCLNIVLSPSCYYEICEALKKHRKDCWKEKMAILRRVYFSNLWRGTGTIAAVILLLLTVIQTICSILQVM